MSEAETTFEISSEIISQVLSPTAAEPDIACLLKSDEIPAWLSEKFVQDILRKYHQNDSIRVKCLRIQQCGGKGESYASVMYRVGIFFMSRGHESVQFCSLIVKTLPQNEMAVEKLGQSNYNVQNKEMEMYQTWLPEFKSLLDAVNEDSKIFPEVLAVDEKLEVIVLKDLCESHFVMADRSKGLDKTHIKLALRKLARMHGASAMILQMKPNAMAHLNTGFFTRETDVFHVMFESLCDALIEELSTWEGYEYYAKKMKNVRENLILNAQKAFDCDDGDFHVLTHGDLWTNNVMYKYDKNGKPIDCVLLDFQFGCYGSPALDLLYFLFTSTIDDLRPEKIDELIQFYYYELKSLLKKLSYDMKSFPSLHGFQIQVLKKYFYAFTSCLLIFPVMICLDKDSSFEILQSRDDWAMTFKKTYFKNPRYQEMAKKILPMLDTKGILDDM